MRLRDLERAGPIERADIGRSGLLVDDGDLRALQRRLGALPDVAGERWRSCQDARVEFRFFQGRRDRARAVADARQARADAGAQSFDLVFSTSSTLRRKHPPEKSDWTFSLIEVSTRPTEALALLDAAGFGSLMTVEGALLNAPTEDWYVPIRAVRALAANRTKVTVVASVWDLRRSGWVGAQLEVRIHYDDGVHAYDAISLNAGGPLLVHSTYDDQRAETGYEGENRTERIADESEVKSFVSVVRALTD